MQDFANSNNVNFNFCYENKSEWKSKVLEILNISHYKERLEAESKARSSEHRVIYPLLQYNLLEPNTSYLSLPVQVISTIIKARCELLSLNYLPHRTDLPEMCTLCNSRQINSVPHFIGKCTIFSEYRRIYFNKSVLSDIEIVNLLNGLDWMKLYNYITEAYNYRRRIINEDF